MRQVADESDRIGQQDVPLGGQRNRTERRIKRSEHSRGFQHSRISECIEQSRLARICITHQSHGRYRNRFAPLPLLRANPANVFDLLFYMPNAAVNSAAIGFKLRFARPSSTDSATELRHFCAAPGQTG